MLPKDFTPGGIQDPTDPRPAETPPEIPQGPEPPSPGAPFRVHPEPIPEDLPASDPPFAPPEPTD